MCSVTAKEVCPDMYWVGVLDPNLRVFDIITTTPFGTSYNSFFLRGSEGCVIFETTKEGFGDEYIKHIRSIMKATDEVKYIVMNHTEPDHSGTLERLLTEFPNATLVATAVGQSNLLHIVHEKAEQVKKVNADAKTVLSVGNYTMQFIPAPLIHWPDTMMTYIPELKILVPCDFLSSHYCFEKVFNDYVTTEEEPQMWQSYHDYYNNIFSPFKSFSNAALDKIKDLDIQIVCCSHGPVLRKNIQHYIQLYREWGKSIPRKNQVIIAFAAAYCYTTHIAEAIAKGVESEGFKAIRYDLVEHSPDEVKKHLSDSKGILLGTPTLLEDAIPHVWEIAISINPCIHTGLFCGVFGSYGWTGEGPKNIQQRFHQAKVNTPLEPLLCRFKPTEEFLKESEVWGASFVKAIKEKETSQ